jgi:hypothetical protein
MHVLNALKKYTMKGKPWEENARVITN